MASYQRQPDGPTVIHPVVVVMPEQTRPESNGYGPSSLILFPGVLGGMVIIGGLLLCCVAGIEGASMPVMRDTFVTVLIVGCALVGIGVALCGLCCCGWKMGKNKHDKLRQRQEKENPAPRYEPYTDDEISAGNAYYGQGQPGVGQPVVGTGSPMYMPIQSAVPSPTHLTK